MKLNDKIIEVIKHFESLHDGDLSVIGLQPKMCPSGYWTEGYGNVIRGIGGKMLQGEKDREHAYNLTTIHNQEEAEKQLLNNLSDYSRQVEKECYRLNFKPADNEFSALVSLSYNCGVGSMKYIIPRILRGEDINTVFGMWNKSGGKVLKGLVIRREAEAYFYKTGEVKI